MPTGLIWWFFNNFFKFKLIIIVIIIRIRIIPKEFVKYEEQ